MESIGVSAREQMAWQERLANSAHVREVADLKAAGLNPVLSSGGAGAATPSGANDLSELMKLSSESITSSAKSVQKTVEQLPEIVKEVADAVQAVKELPPGVPTYGDRSGRHTHGAYQAMTEADRMAERGLYWNGTEYAPESHIDLSDESAGSALSAIRTGLSVSPVGRMLAKVLLPFISKKSIKTAVSNVSSSKRAYQAKKALEDIGEGSWLSF